jgi:prolyl-tRNA synthetase
LRLKRPDFDKFAGADYSVAFDAWNPDGKSNQIGTVHQLGYNFGKAFDLTYETENGDRATATNTCYGMGFGRTLAAVISQHGDDHGLVLPPVVAPKQLVIIPILVRGKEEATKNYASEINASLKGSGIRSILDDDDRLRPGEKFYKWEMFGVPLRIEVGPREVESRTVTLVRRDIYEKTKASVDNLTDTVKALLDSIRVTMSERSKKVFDERMANASTLEELRKYMEQKKLVRINWCDDISCSERLKDQVSGEIRGTLWDKKEEPTGPCIICGDPAKSIAYVSRTY